MSALQTLFIKVKKDLKILMIGGTGRNVGKTEFVCNCINHFSKSLNIIGLKVTNHFHETTERPYRVTEEVNNSTTKDTSRMLRAGASKVFYVQSEAKHLTTAFADFRKLISPNSIIICESSGLREIIEPGLFLIVKLSDKAEIKPTAKKMIPLANKVIISDGKSFSIKPTNISFDNSCWEIND